MQAPGDGTVDDRALPIRKTLDHGTPTWVGDEAVYFLTICARPRGVNQLCRPDIATHLWESVLYREMLRQWVVYSCVLMPDHVHLLVRVAPEPGLPSVVSAWKRFTARQFGISWQRDFFDRRLRGNGSVEEKAEYIRQNPVRAGLAARPEDWPYNWGRQGAFAESAADIG